MNHPFYQPEPAAPKPQKPIDPNKPYGWDVAILHHDGSMKTYHYIGSQGKARRQAMLKRLAKQVIDISPVTKTQWIRAYGDPTTRM